MECPNCTWQFESVTNLRQHYCNIHLPIICQGCSPQPKCFDNAISYGEHPEHDEAAVVCVSCDQMFETFRLWQAHAHKEHLQICVTCECFWIDNTQELADHVKNDPAHIKIREDEEKEKEARREREEKAKLEKEELLKKTMRQSLPPRTPRHDSDDNRAKGRRAVSGPVAGRRNTGGWQDGSEQSTTAPRHYSGVVYSSETYNSRKMGAGWRKHQQREIQVRSALKLSPEEKKADLERKADFMRWKPHEEQKAWSHDEEEKSSDENEDQPTWKSPRDGWTDVSGTARSQQTSRSMSVSISSSKDESDKRTLTQADMNDLGISNRHPTVSSGASTSKFVDIMDQLSAKFVDTETELANTRSQLEIVQLQLEKKKAELKQAKKESQEHRELAQSIREEMLQEVAFSDKKAFDASLQMSHAETARQNTNRELKRLQNLILDKDVSIKGLENDIEGIKRQAEHFRIEVNRKTQVIEQLEQEIFARDKLKEENDELKGENKLLQKSHDRAQALVAKRNLDISLLRNRVKDLEKDKAKQARSAGMGAGMEAEQRGGDSAHLTSKSSPDVTGLGSPFSAISYTSAAMDRGPLGRHDSTESVIDGETGGSIVGQADDDDVGGGEEDEDGEIAKLAKDMHTPAGRAMGLRFPRVVFDEDVED